MGISFFLLAAVPARSSSWGNQENICLPLPDFQLAPSFGKGRFLACRIFLNVAPA
jgi:hypothetical protein